ncbi:hypothetical protein DUI87_01431 [Hirundo rustica rustica]|uniref:Uncharacterized protein n=1 Tax=Hirundo rustica rustica TaxID=333673 RepID=A0A3M0LC00_HIRRU|nr:hypothetical protein DUI87_01431 [Hirundo rustica rustica]
MLVLDSWLNLLERKQVFVTEDDFQRLYLHGKNQGFFFSPEKAFSKEIWSELGDHMIQTLSAGFNADVAELMFWKRCYTVIASYGSSNSGSAGKFSGLDGEAEREEQPLSEAEEEPSFPPQAAAQGDVPISGKGIGSPRVDGAPSQLVPANQQVGGDLRASGGPVETCLLHQKEIWEMEVVTRPSESQCRDGKHGDVVGWYAIDHHASCRLAGPHHGSEGLFLYNSFAS